jgi:hypothetical protein
MNRFFSYCCVALFIISPVFQTCLGEEGVSEPDQAVSPLIACPDCGASVSKRAVSCPHCGCPGDAIAEEALRLTAEDKLSPYVMIKAPNAGGKGLAIQMEDQTFVITAFSVLGNLESLSLLTVKGENVSYTGIELSATEAWVRLPVRFEDLLYVKPDPQATTLLTWQADGSPRLSAEVTEENATVVWTPLEWIPVKPSVLRQQIQLIQRAREEQKGGKLSVETIDAINKMQWTTPWLKNLTAEFKDNP